MNVQNDRYALVRELIALRRLTLVADAGGCVDSSAYAQPFAGEVAPRGGVSRQFKQRHTISQQTGFIAPGGRDVHDSRANRNAVGRRMRPLDRLDDTGDVVAVHRAKIRSRASKDSEMAGDRARRDARERDRDDPATYWTGKRNGDERAEQPKRAIARDDQNAKRVRRERDREHMRARVDVERLHHLDCITRPLAASSSGSQAPKETYVR